VKTLSNCFVLHCSGYMKPRWRKS